MAFDRNSDADKLALKTEVTTDPLGLGYNLDDSNQIVATINEVRTSAPTFTLSKPKISSALVRSTCTYDAYNALSIDEQEWIRWMTGSNGFEEENLVVTPDLRLRLTDAEGDGTGSIWAAGDRAAMNAAMLALIDRFGSRAEDLFGIDTQINREDWLAARDS